ncbi:MAG TPA: hypothetical protein VNL17_10540 [Verrucomicrobiae bacterium]|nr:hypothetical protein [Verrucomicrobiae bacterium]
MGFGLSVDSTARREQGFSLPHPGVTLAVFLVIEEAVVAAWNILHVDPPRPFDPSSAHEVDFTTHLHEILEDHLLDSNLVNGFTGDVFSSIKRPEVRNYDGVKTSKKPDMVAYLADRPNVKRSQDGIFIECKPVDAAHSLLADYCDAGIERFIVGDYAWAMTEALMIGYNTVHQKPSAALVQPFQARANKINAIGKPRDCKISAHKPAVAITRHRRSFVLRGKRAGAITLRHLWLSMPN